MRTRVEFIFQSECRLNHTIRRSQYPCQLISSSMNDSADVTPMTSRKLAPCTLTIHLIRPIVLESCPIRVYGTRSICLASDSLRRCVKKDKAVKEQESISEKENPDTSFFRLYRSWKSIPLASKPISILYTCTVCFS